MQKSFGHKGYINFQLWITTIILIVSWFHATPVHFSCKAVSIKFPILWCLSIFFVFVCIFWDFFIILVALVYNSSFDTMCCTFIERLHALEAKEQWLQSHSNTIFVLFVFFVKSTSTSGDFINYVHESYVHELCSWSFLGKIPQWFAIAFCRPFNASGPPVLHIKAGAFH